MLSLTFFLLGIFYLALAPWGWGGEIAFLFLLSSVPLFWMNLIWDTLDLHIHGLLALMKTVTDVDLCIYIALLTLAYFDPNHYDYIYIYIYPTNQKRTLQLREKHTTPIRSD